MPIIDQFHARRTHFTDEDETNLCKWIALKIPFKETGGRTGNRLYQQLVEMVSKRAVIVLTSFLRRHSVEP